MALTKMARIIPLYEIYKGTCEEDGWNDDLKRSEVEHGWGVMAPEENDRLGMLAIERLDLDQLEEATGGIEVFDFIGSEEGTRFYAKDVEIWFRESDWSFWAIDCDDLYEV